ncbi:phenylalanine--tRNA ligase subunit beta [Boudabousia liubingyangii]|uniref:Phenylalanine--tRNA ligase beta subunit n=1 Tax=Boudabousia liubingyangii TaxID=1921764 RepID=A0A1Q5PKL2_9ACTO|nr:phenylalanine--tRNA ligase subunit beta [Boudabousia liubingyangii]OKL47174.1 phenylalanine--tRNA ligase subunit beta [Boudabousia liubingyangii]
MPYVSLEWLGEHVAVDPKTTVEELAAALVKVGLEEEQIVPPAVQGPLVVGKVLTRDPKEQSNGKVINYCRVDVGQYNDEPGTGKEPSDLPSRGIICGAHNFEVGDYVVVSLPGAVLPGGFEIAARKTYGHVSDGMMCSETELGLAESSEGIIILQDYLDGPVPEVGTDLVSRLGLGEELLEINITPDRGYCFSMRGVAREYSHSTGVAFVDPVEKLEVPAASADAFEVRLEDQAPIRGNVGCDRFATRVLTNLDPAAKTPAWMEKRLIAAGMRPISLIVDVTNYVMLDLGQPLHAYDLAQVAAPIVVRRANEGESLKTLDDVDRQLQVEDLVISDSPEGNTGARILGLAGVMGGASSEVSEATTSVLLEAAHFDGISIARTARRHKLPSEAAKRFERGTDPELPAAALQRAVDLLVEYGGAQVESAVGDVNNTAPRTVIDFDWRFPERLIGVQYTESQVREALTQIGCQIEEAGETWCVTVPSWRPDIEASVHLVEEVARLEGYDQIPSILPQAVAGRGLAPAIRARREVATALCGNHLTQVLSYPFIGAAHDLQMIPAGDTRRRAVRLANPMADDAPFMRTSVLDSLLDVAQRNVARGNENFAIFETGMVTLPDGCEPAELPKSFAPSQEELAQIHRQVPAQPWHLGAVWGGKNAGPAPLNAARDYDWADAVETARLVADVLGAKLVIAAPLYEGEEPTGVNLRALQGQGILPISRESVAPFHPGRVAQLRLRVGKKLQVIGYAGELHPQVVKNYNLPARSVALELDLSVLIEQISGDPFQVKAISTYPVAKEDLAFIVPADLAVGDVLTELKKAAGPLLESVALFDEYRSEQLGADKKSLAFALRMRGQDKTLTAAEIQDIRKRICAQLEKRFGATLRG